MTTEQLKKRKYLSRAKTVYKQLKKLQKQIIKDQRQKKFLSEIGVSDDALNKKIEHDIQQQRKQIAKLIAFDKEIKRIILTVQNDTLETILVRYYLLYESFPKVAEKMIYEPRHVQRLFYQAIDKIRISEVEGL
ncbi:MAG: hypothetical protein K2H93_03775 [Oscillospiraceae bacterium]|nr:hypothetical protein [Oscillospiraceae bacterium]